MHDILRQDKIKGYINCCHDSYQTYSIREIPMKTIFLKHFHHIVTTTEDQDHFQNRFQSNFCRSIILT